MSLIKSEISTDAAYPGRKILRKMNYYRDQKGIMNRYLREHEGWDNHRKNTMEFILKCIRAKNPKSLSVLGSGWLLDFPLEAVYKVCKDIRLIDIHHPPQVLRKIKDYPGVTAVLSDITGGMIENVYQFAQETIKSGEEHSLKELQKASPIPNADTFYISLNILNQLDILLVDYLKKFVKLKEEEWNELRKFVQDSHLKLLGSDSCLISDVEEMTENFKDKTINSKKLIHVELPAGKYADEWIWDFDTAGMYYPNKKTRFRVVALSC